MSAVDVALALAALPVLSAAGYLALLALLARPVPPPRVPRRPGTRPIAFDVLVPAHDESSGIAGTLASLRALDYPRAHYRVVVIADNCADDTAVRAARGGAVVLERRDAARRGKGYALAFGYAASVAHAFADAVVVVDADTLVSPNLLAAFAARLDAGIECVQADYAVRNPASSWRTRLAHLAFTLYHRVRSQARERLGVSCGLRGNGMCLSTALLRRVPHHAVSLVEDVEHGLALGLAGVRVAFAGEAWVRGEMPTGAAAAATQRARWEGGRRALARRYVPALLRAAAARRDPVPLDLAIDLLVPPLVQLGLASAAGAALAAVLVARGHAGALGIAPWVLAVAALAAYVARGWHASGGRARDALGLALWAPVYATWKIAHMIRPRATPGTAGWVRTARELRE